MEYSKGKKDHDIEIDLNSIRYTAGTRPLILNFHVPPKDIGIDSVVALDEGLKPIINSGGPQKISVGSKSVLDFIKRVEPSLGLFGHVHEAKGISTAISLTSPLPTTSFVGVAEAMCSDNCCNIF